MNEGRSYLAMLGLNTGGGVPCCLPARLLLKLPPRLRFTKEDCKTETCVHVVINTKDKCTGTHTTVRYTKKRKKYFSFMQIFHLLFTQHVMR